jgi:hypothetical protein
MEKSPVYIRGDRRMYQQMARLQLEKIPSASFKDKPTLTLTLITHTNSNTSEEELVEM